MNDPNDPNRPGGYPPPPGSSYPPPPGAGYPPPQGTGYPPQPYGGPYAPPPRKSRGGLIALIVLLVLAATGAGLYFTGVLDPLLKKAGLIDMASYEADGSYTSRGLRNAQAIIGGKRWARPGECQSDWTDFRTDGTASSANGTQGTWELLQNQDLILRDGTTGRATTLKASADYALNETIGDFRLEAPNARSVAMQHCGVAQ